MLPLLNPPAPKIVLPGPSRGIGDRVFRRLLACFAFSVLAMTGLLAVMLAYNSRLAWSEFGWRFATTEIWDPVEEVFGGAPYIFGTLYSSALAMLIALPLGVGSAIFLAELAPKRLGAAAAFLIELLAAVPSVVLGLMGIFILVPGVRSVEPWLIKNLGWTPFFTGAPYGVGMLAASLILALMVLPYITSITREVLLSVPRPLKEAMLALGSTRWEVVRRVSLPYARSGIAGGAFLALGRALGETMAVTMVIGNTPRMSWSLLDPSYTMAAVIANEFAEATSDAHIHALIAIGAVLFGITFLVNGAARLMIHRLEGNRA